MTQKLDADLNIIQNSDIEVQIDPLTKDLNIIQALDDEPNDVGGLTAAELKAKFDEAGNLIKEYINDTLIPQVLSEGVAEKQREQQEQVRQDNEAQRQANEKVRQGNETARVEAEAARSVWEDYDPAKSYVPGNKVYWAGSSYVNTAPCTGIPPNVAANWQMIAKRGETVGDGMTQEDGDARYLQLSGGWMTGPMTVQDPELPNSPANLRFLQPESISVARLPDKTGYRVGEIFDPSGMIVSAKYYGDATERVTGFTVDPCVFRDDTEKLTVLYAENRSVKSVEMPVYPSVEVNSFSQAMMPGKSYWNNIAYAVDIWIITSSTSMAARSEDGKIWEKVTMPSSGNGWRAPVYADIFVAVSISGNNAAYSEDKGKTWKGSKLPVISSGHAYKTPVFADDVLITFADYFSNQAAYSEDGGRTWTGATLPFESSWELPIFTDGVWFAMPPDTSSYSTAAYSEDGGKTWNQTSLLSSQRWEPPVNGDGVLIIYNKNQSSSFLRSENGGKTWELISLGISLEVVPPKFGDGVWITAAVTGGKALYSEDGGKTWAQAALTAGAYGDTPVYADGVWIILLTGAKTARSEDGGKTWTTVNLPTAQIWRNPICTGGVWFAAPKASSNAAAYSEDGGETWTETELPVSQEWDEPVFKDGILFLFPTNSAASNTAAYSKDGGKTWVHLPLSDSYTWGKPVYGDSMWIMGASNVQTTTVSYSELKKTFSLLPGENVPPAPETALETQVNALMGAIERGLSL